MTNVTYIYSRLLLGFLVASTSYCSALIQAASQSPLPSSSNSSSLGCAGSGLPSLGLPVLLPNQGVLVVLQDSVLDLSMSGSDARPEHNCR